VNILVWVYSCRCCGAEVTLVGGRRRRFCDDCLLLLTGNLRGFRRRRFPRRLLGVGRSR
jgi:hypothetical protein